MISRQIPRIVIVCLCIAICLCLFALCWQIVEFVAHRSEQARIRTLIRYEAREPAPAGCSNQLWAQLWEYNINCAANAIALQEDIGIDQLRRLRSRLETECRGPATVDSVERIYDAFAESSPAGQVYTSRYRPDFEHFLAKAKSRRVDQVGTPP